MNIGLDTVYNQGKTGACTVFALIACVNIIKKSGLDPAKIWEEIKLGPAKAGSRWIQGAIKYAKKKKRVGTSTSITSIEQIKNSINLGYPIITTSARIDWRATNQSLKKIAVFDDLIDSKHARHIIGYDEARRLFICRNSGGPTRGHRGNFYLNYSDIAKVGSKYSLTS